MTNERTKPSSGLDEAELSLEQRKQRKQNMNKPNTVLGNKKLNGPNLPAE